MTVSVGVDRMEGWSCSIHDKGGIGVGFQVNGWADSTTIHQKQHGETF